MKNVQCVTSTSWNISIIQWNLGISKAHYVVSVILKELQNFIQEHMKEQILKFLKSNLYEFYRCLIVLQFQLHISKQKVHSFPF